MPGVAVEVDRAAMAQMNAMLDRIGRESPKRLATETRRAALYICQGLKKRTRKAPKRIRKSEYAAVPSPVPPRYIHARNGRLLRRWMLSRKLGTPDAYAKHYYVYSQARRGRNGKMVGKNNAAEKRELLRLHGGITRHGLAKKSWGWVAKGVHSASNQGDLSWKRTKGERRDPRQYVKGMFRAVLKGAEARLRNRLDYIVDAMHSGAVGAAIIAARKRLEYNIKHHIERMTRK